MGEAISDFGVKENSQKYSASWLYTVKARALSFENLLKQCLVGNMRRAEVLAQKMDEEQAIWIKPDQFEGTESEKGFYFPAPNYETYEILASGWQRLGMADEVGELRKVYWWQKAFKKQGSDTKSKPLAGSRGAVEDARAPPPLGPCRCDRDMGKTAQRIRGGEGLWHVSAKA